MTNKEVIQKFSELDYRLRHIVVNRCEEMPITNVGKIVIYDSQIFFWNGTTYERILTEDDLEGLVTELELAWLTQDIQDALVNANAPDASNPYATFNDILSLPAPITVVANYSALPDPTTVTGEFYWAEASQGTSWLPGSLGGTYYNAGMYYSNGVSWSYLETPYQATQLEVNAGTVDNKFVTPLTGQVAYAFKPGITGGQTLVGGTQVTDALTLQGTSGNGTLTDKAIRVLVGNNGSTEALNVTNNGYVNVGQRIYLGTATGTGRINLPDGGTTSADGIQFGSDVKIYRSAANTIQFLGSSAGGGITFNSGGGGIITGGSDGEMNIRSQFGLTLRQLLGGNLTTVFPTVLLTPPTLTGSQSTSALSITQTWNTTGNPTAIFLNVTNTASGASSRLLDIQANSVSQFRVDRVNGLVTVLNTITAGNINSSNAIYLSNYQSGFRSMSSGVIRLMNNTETDFNRLQWGGSTNLFPSLKRNGTDIQIRLADDSGDTGLLALTIKATQVAGYISSDGSAGATGTFTTTDLKTVTVKDGIITSII